MKALAKVGLSLIIFVIFATGGSYAQITADLFIENAHISGGYFYWEIHITPTNDWGSGGIYNKKALGDCSWYFDYNSSALSNPVLTYANQSYVTTTEGYTNTASLAGGKVYVDTDLDRSSWTGANQTLAQGTKHHIYTVRMDIDNPLLESDLYWDQVNTGIYNANDDPVTESYYNNGDMALPVQMIDMIATTNREEGVVLAWSTESETNCAGFHVCRSKEEGGEYTRITTTLISGHGNTSSKQEYTYADRNVEDGVEYWYKIEEILMNGTSSFYGPISVMGINTIPTEYALSQNYPNPFNPQTTLKYDLPEDAKVFIVVYNMLGQRVRLLIDKSQTAGYYRVTWDGLDDYGSMVSSGIYFVHLQTDKFSQVRRITFVR